MEGILGRTVCGDPRRLQSPPKVRRTLSFFHQLKDSRHMSLLLRGQRLGRGQEAIKRLGSQRALGWYASHGDLSVKCGLGYSSRSEESGTVHFSQSRSLYSRRVFVFKLLKFLRRVDVFHWFPPPLRG
jgi:hypothetical protein